MLSRLAAKRWFLPVLIVGFSVVGVVGVLAGDARGRVIGWCSLLFFGLGGGPVVIRDLVVGPPPRPEPAEVTLPDGTRVPGLIIEYRAFPAVLRAVSGIGLAAGSAVFALAPRSSESFFDSPPARVVVGLCGAYIGLAFGLRLLRRQAGPDSFALTASGLLVTAGGTRRYIAWQAVTQVARADVSGTPILAVVGRSPEDVVRSGGAGVLDDLGAIFTPRNRILVPLKSLALSPDAAGDLVRQAVDSSRDPDATWFDQLAGRIVGSSAATI